MTDLTAFGALFASAFLAATLLPASSEVVLGALIAGGTGPAWLLVAVATVGNVLGSATNWVLGRFLIRFRERAWFPVPPVRIEQAASWFRRFGVWSLLFAWLPLIGDALTLVAGLFRVGFGRFLVLVTLGKAARYAAIATGALWWAEG